ncbi:zinc finger protein 502-like [Anopheles bellator]|uniref:zinc finger protein 502-like n=1 Tax=Anopheles bellator TaxID=139047 RepID=UPI00264719BB|nr:zinc finger protein 502-like [Anopheles bellator]
MVHFCKLCQLLHKNMDFIQCDETNVWLLETVFAVKITPVNGRVEPICQKCIRKYNKVMKDLKKSNGGYPVSRQSFTDHKVLSNGIESDSCGAHIEQQQHAPGGLLVNHTTVRTDSNQYLVDEESKEIMFTGTFETNVNHMENKGFSLNISGDAATVYRTTLGDAHESSEDDSSDEKSSVADEEDDEEDTSDESSEEDDDCMVSSDDSDETSSSCTSSSSSEDSSSETATSLKMEEDHIVRPNAVNEEATALYSSYLEAPLLQNLPEGSLLQSAETDEANDVNTDLVAISQEKPVEGDDLEPLQLAEPLAEIEENPVTKVDAPKKPRKRKKSRIQSTATDLPVKNYECLVCQKRFSKAIYLKVHTRTHTGEKPYACDICFKSFTQASSLNTHKRLHFNVKPFECEICKQQYTSAGNYKVHLRTHTQEKPYACSYCDKRFSQHSSKKMHERVHSQEKPYPCQVCLKAFSNVSNLTVHMRIHQGLKPYRCDKCDKSFAQSQTLKTHYISAHTDVRPFQCDRCPKSYATLSNLNNHKHTHLDEKPFACEACGKRFTQKSSLKTHLLSHSTERPFPCDDCTKSFNTQSMLNTHRRNMHCTERPYSCPKCSKSYAQETRLRQHMFSHEEIKPHACQQCDKTFTTATNLRIHQRVHSGEKPFPCPTCGKCFSQRSSLRTHEILHLAPELRPDAANTCVPETDGQPGQMTEGSKKRRSKRLECSPCGKIFTVRSRYRSHMKQVHQREITEGDKRSRKNMNGFAYNEEVNANSFDGNAGMAINAQNNVGDCNELFVASGSAETTYIIDHNISELTPEATALKSDDDEDEEIDDEEEENEADNEGKVKVNALPEQFYCGRMLSEQN